MPPRIRLIFSSLMVVLFLIPAISLYRELSRRNDIWWTPYALRVPLAESQDRVEIYVGGRPIGALLEAGELRLTDQPGSSILSPQEIALRFNNWDRVRAQRIPVLLTYAAVCGAMAVLFLLVVTGRLVYRGETPREVRP